MSIKNQKISLKPQREVPKHVMKAVEEFLDNKFPNYSFNTQEDLISDMKAYYKEKNKETPEGLIQSNISRALKKAMTLCFLNSSNNPYVLVKEKGKLPVSFKNSKVNKIGRYHFIKMDIAFIPLFKLQDCYIKDSLHIMSHNTLVFNIPKSKHKIFVDTLIEHFPPDTLWDYSSLENHIILMFNFKTKSQQAICALFKTFFKMKQQYEATNPDYVNKTAVQPSDAADNNAE
jgi:hypothetical protein